MLGMFGFIILTILLIPMYHIPASQPFTSPDGDGRLENPFDAFAQLRQNWQIVFATFGTWNRIIGADLRKILTGLCFLQNVLFYVVLVLSGRVKL